MPRTIAALIAGAAVALTAAVPAQAITTLGVPDNGRHPEVGALVYKSSRDNKYHALCTGTLIAPRVFLTASHCVQALFDFNLPARVTFAEETTAAAASEILVGAPRLNPLYRPRQGYQHDVSAVLLDAPVTTIAPARIPGEGLLDLLKATRNLSTFTLPGYGSAEKVVVPGLGPTFPGGDSRLLAVLGYAALTQSQLKQSQKISQGQAGACYGDSGGPSFLGSGAGETPIVVAVTSTGDTPCYATNVAARTDTSEAQDFLRALPGVN